jgi:hypothetical protein
MLQLLLIVFHHLVLAQIVLLPAENLDVIVITHVEEAGAGEKEGKIIGGGGGGVRSNNTQSGAGGGDANCGRGCGNSCVRLWWLRPL